MKTRLFLRMSLLALIILTGCGSHKDGNTVLGPTTAQNATKPTAELALAASDSAQANAHVLFRDLRGFNTVTGEVEVLAYLGPALIDQSRADASSVFLALAFDEADFDVDGDVDFDDFFYFADKWPSTSDRTYHVRIDLDGNGRINLDDFFIFADHFGRHKIGGLAKPAVFKDVPDEVPATIGGMSPETTAQAVAGLRKASTRAAKIAQTAPTYRLVVRSLESKFAPLDTLVTVNFTQLRDIVLRVNTPPTVTIPLGGVDTISVGDTLRVVMPKVFDSDDSLHFDVVKTVLPWSIVQSSILVITPVSPGVTGITFRGTDSAGQSVTYELLVEAKERPLPPAPPDTLAPVATVTLNADTTAVSYTVVDDSLVTTVATLDGQVVFTDTVSMGSIPLTLSDGTHYLNMVFTDKSGNTAKSEYQLIRPDSEAPTMDAPGEWSGTAYSFSGVFVDTLSGVGSWGISIEADGKLIFDQNGSGQGRNHLNLSFEVNFPSVTQVTRREIKMRCRDMLGNPKGIEPARRSIFIDQPISPVVVTPPPPPPPPPPPVVITPPPPNIADARVDGVAPGGNIQAVTSTISCTAPASGHWTLGGQSADGTSVTLNAVSGTLTLTMNGATATWQISAVPAPKRIVLSTPTK